MSTRLVTVGTFDLAPKAQFARGLLEEAGIPVVVDDEGIVAMEFILAAAVGGIKVKVREEDAGRAAEVLATGLDASGRPAGRIDDEELTRQALDAPPDVPEVGYAEAARTADPEEPPAGPADGERDEYARRFLYAAVFSLIVPLMAFYAVYLGLNAAFAPGTLSAVGGRRVVGGGMALMVGLLFVSFICRGAWDPWPWW